MVETLTFPEMGRNCPSAQMWKATASITEVTAVACERQHRHLFPHCLSSRSPCLYWWTHRRKISALYHHTIHQLPDSVWLRCDSGLQEVCLHGKVNLPPKTHFQTHHTSSQALNFMIISNSNHCQYEHEGEKHLSTHTATLQLKL